jgi:anthranilate synthase component 1
MEKIVLTRKPIYIPSSDNEDVFQLFLQLEQAYDNCYIFESLGESGEMARYTILGFDPEYIVSGNGNLLKVNDREYTVDNPYTALSELVPQDCFSYNYAGGAVGYLGYNAINFFEPTLAIRPHSQFDQFLFGIYTDGVMYDKLTGQLTYFYYNKNRLQEIVAVLQTKIHKKSVSISGLSENTSKKEHAEMVKRVQGEIISGNTFQTVIGIQAEFSIQGDTVELYKRLREVNPSPFMYYVKFGKQKIIGASPELLFGMRNKEMTSFPLAGTSKRGKTQKEDQALARALLNNP